MNLKLVSTQCPYCWEKIDIQIDPSVFSQDYIEDCSVCCRPIRLIVNIDNNNEIQIESLSQDD
jgi:hypothetical protein